jgi:hypothetical protein
MKRGNHHYPATLFGFFSKTFAGWPNLIDPVAAYIPQADGEQGRAEHHKHDEVQRRLRAADV